MTVLCSAILESQGQDKQPLVVTGMHRSATSFAARVFHQAGISFGEKLVPATCGNRLGHFENIAFQEFHREVLKENGLSEDGWIPGEKVAVSERHRSNARKLVRESERAPNWGWKDPRTTLLLDFWRNVLPDARFIFMYRAAWEVADSLYRRNEIYDQVFFSRPELAIELWIDYNLRLLRFFDAYPASCVLINANRAVDSPAGFLQTLNDRFHIPLPPPPRGVSAPELFNSQISSSCAPQLVCRNYPVVGSIWQQLEERSSLPSGLGRRTSRNAECCPMPELQQFGQWVAWRRNEQPDRRSSAF